MLKRGVETTCDGSRENLVAVYWTISLPSSRSVSDKNNKRISWERKKNENKINFWFLFIILELFGAVSSMLTHEIPTASTKEAEMKKRKEKKCFTTKTIMDPLIGFLDSVLVSLFYFL